VSFSRAAKRAAVPRQAAAGKRATFTPPSASSRFTSGRPHDAVVQGLSEAPFMKDISTWGIFTIGTGLGNALFTNRELQRWSRLSEQIFRIDKWSLCRGQAAKRSGSGVK
jgi:hypothetical protein